MKWMYASICQLFLSLLLAACADAPAISLVIAPTVTPTKPADRLNIFSQDQAIDPATLANFEARFEVKVNYATVAEHETGLADIQAGLANYDLAILSDTLVASLRGGGLFAPLDKSHIPNFKNIDPTFANPLFDPGNRYCAAYQWGAMGLGYNLSTTGRELQSWADFFEADPPLRLGLPDDNRLALATGLLYLGYSPNTTNDLEIAQAQELLTQHAGQFITYAPTTGQALLANGQVDLLFARNGAISQMMTSNPTLRYTLPSEGSLIWVDSLCLLATTSHPELAETFINYILNPQVSAALADETHYASPNQAALPWLNPLDRNNPALYPDDDLRRRLFFLVNVDPAASQRYQQTWTGLLANPNFQAPAKSN